jgi:hypothetical protein
MGSGNKYHKMGRGCSIRGREERNTKLYIVGKPEEIT